MAFQKKKKCIKSQKSLVNWGQHMIAILRTKFGIVFAGTGGMAVMFTADN